MSQENPRAIQIMQNDKDGNCSLDLAAINHLFRKTNILDKPLCIVSIAGAFRKGKSFMLNFFLRYLRNKGYKNPKWIGDTNTTVGEGIEWKGGKNACTSGILVWNEIFFVAKHGQEVAVVLIDTQGLYDNKTSMKANTTIFSLSTLISCVQIFNLSTQVLENDLGFLHFFTEYARAAGAFSHTTQFKPLETLIFLVRDWPNTRDHAFGFDGGKEYIEELLKTEMLEKELESVRTYLSQSFEDIKCCLLPHPGPKVATDRFSGYLYDIDAEFLEHIAYFIDGIMKPENLVLKSINGEIMTGSTMLQYLRMCNECFSSGQLPSPKTMVEAFAETQNYQARKNCSKHYSSSMEEKLHFSGGNFVEDLFLKKVHEEQESCIMIEFNDRTKFGDEKNRKTHRDDLTKDIAHAYRELTDRNESNRSKAMKEADKELEEIIKKYKGKLHSATREDPPLAVQDLEKLGNKFAAEADKAFASSRKFHPILREKYSTKLRRSIGNIYGECKRQNDDKLQIVNEKETTKRKLLELKQKLSAEYKAELQKVASIHVPKQRLLQKNEELRSSMVEEFQKNAKGLLPPKDITKYEQNIAIVRNELQQSLTAIFDFIDQDLQVKIENYRTQLEEKRSEILLGYNDAIKEILKDKYVNPVALRHSHDQIVNKIITNLRNEAKEAPHSPLYTEHLEQAKKDLDEKWKTTKELNDMNYSYWGALWGAINQPQVMAMALRLIEIVLNR